MYNVPRYVYMHCTFGLWFVSKSDYSLSTTTVCQAFIMNSEERREVRLRRRRERRAAERRRVADRARFAARTAEQREARVQQMSATAQQRLASETAEQRLARRRVADRAMFAAFSR